MAAAAASASLYHCPRCGLGFNNHKELGGHLSIPVCSPNNMLLAPLRARPPAVPTREEDVLVEDVEAPTIILEPCEDNSGGDDGMDEQRPLEGHQLIQRPCKDEARHIVRRAIRQPCAYTSNPDNTYKLHQVCASYMCIKCAPHI